MHQKIWSRTDMQLSADQISSDEDLESAAANLQRNQGFVIESVQAEAILKHQCHLTVAKGNLGSRHYALAFPKGSALTDKVSKLILEYSENGILFTLKQKWNQPQNCSHSESIKDINSSRALPFCKYFKKVFKFEFKKTFVLTGHDAARLCTTQCSVVPCRAITHQHKKNSNCRWPIHVVIIRGRDRTSARLHRAPSVRLPAQQTGQLLPALQRTDRRARGQSLRYPERRTQ